MYPQIQHLSHGFLLRLGACGSDEIDSKHSSYRIQYISADTDHYFDVVHLTCEETKKAFFGKAENSNYEGSEFSCGTRTLNEPRSYDYEVSSIKVDAPTSIKECTHNSLVFSYNSGTSQAIYTDGPEGLNCVKGQNGFGNTAEPCSTVREKE
ncbi:MAG: hypothetical protein CMP10_18900 [Zetaproteobacteria bacterium]|nr:hypothetical protein [Pseudobdellovibrionaceae bacterium]